MNEEKCKESLSNTMMDYDVDEGECEGSKMTDDEKIDMVARKVLERHRAAFEELAKCRGERK